MDQLDRRAARIAAALVARKETVAVCESSIGGLLSAALVAVPGASAFYVGGAVVYTRAAGRGLLAVPDHALAGLRSATEPYARLNARTIRERLGASWGIAETGASGPAGNRYGDAAGHACFAVAGPGGVELSATLETGSADRAANMRAFATGALDLLERALA